MKKILLSLGTFAAVAAPVAAVIACDGGKDVLPIDLLKTKDKDVAYVKALVMLESEKNELVSQIESSKSVDELTNVMNKIKKIPPAVFTKIAEEDKDVFETMSHTLATSFSGTYLGSWSVNNLLEAEKTLDNRFVRLTFKKGITQGVSVSDPNLTVRLTFDLTSKKIVKLEISKDGKVEFKELPNVEINVLVKKTSPIITAIDDYFKTVGTLEIKFVESSNKALFQKMAHDMSSSFGGVILGSWSADNLIKAETLGNTSVRLTFKKGEYGGNSDGDMIVRLTFDLTSKKIAKLEISKDGKVDFEEQPASEIKKGFGYTSPITTAIENYLKAAPATTITGTGFHDNLFDAWKVKDTIEEKSTLTAWDLTQFDHESITDIASARKILRVEFKGLRDDQKASCDYHYYAWVTVTKDDGTKQVYNIEPTYYPGVGSMLDS